MIEAWPLDATLQWTVDYDRDSGAVKSLGFEWFGGTFAGLSYYFLEAMEIGGEAGLRFTLGDIDLEIVSDMPERLLWVVKRV
jgi:hypothetical protein